MPENHLAVDTDGLKKAVDPFMSFATDMQRVAYNLANNAARLQAAFGNDASGQAALKNYRPTASTLIDGMTSISRVLVDTAEGIATSSRGFANTEQESVHAASAFGSGLSNPNPAGGDGGHGRP